MYYTFQHGECTNCQANNTNFKRVNSPVALQIRIQLIHFCYKKYKFQLNFFSKPEVTRNCVMRPRYES